MQAVSLQSLQSFLSAKVAQVSQFKQNGFNLKAQNNAMKDTFGSGCCGCDGGCGGKCGGSRTSGC